MPLLLPRPVGFGYYATNDDSPGSGGTYGTTITASGTTNTKGSWTSLTVNPTYDLYWHRITITNANASASSIQVLVDIGISNDATNFTVVIENLLGGDAASFGGQLGRQYELPLWVPAGWTIYARCQSSTASQTINVAIDSWGGLANPESFPRVGLVQSIGATTASSDGTSITPGASGAMGAYAQLTASSASDYCGITMAHTTTDTTQAAGSYVGLLGIGAATEQELGKCYAGSHNASEFINSLATPIWCDIPATTRIAAKMSCTGTADSTISAVAYGFVRG